VCVVDWDLMPIAGELKPSIESAMHVAVYQTRPDARVVIHTHQIYASACALIGRPIPSLFDEQVRYLGRSVEIVPYAPSGTGWLKKNIASRLRNHCNAYILQNHGALTLGATPERAMFNVELLEKCALTPCFRAKFGSSANHRWLEFRAKNRLSVKFCQEAFQALGHFGGKGVGSA
jgi:ribulose-5-phosphate 4-epimerase/fuculose-1-phosphate aldolase